MNKAALLAEVAVLSRLSHPKIVQILGACVDTAEWGLIIEYAERGDLHGVLRSHSDLPLWRRLQFAIDIAEGMAWLSGEQCQILHRDLKPQNVLVDSDWTAKVADFGLSQLTRQREHSRDRGHGPGTALWMAPEVRFISNLIPLCPGVAAWVGGPPSGHVCLRSGPLGDHHRAAAVEQH